MKESTTQRQTSTDHTSKDKMVDMDELLLWLLSAITSSKAKIGLPN